MAGIQSLRFTAQASMTGHQVHPGKESRRKSRLLLPARTQRSSSESDTSSPRARWASLSFLAFFFSLLFNVFFCCFTFTTFPAQTHQGLSATDLSEC